MILLARPVTAELMQLFNDRVEPLLTQAGAGPVALLQTKPAPSTYPALPVREGEHVLVRFKRFPAAAAHAGFSRRLADSRAWETVQRQLRSHLLAPPQQLRLQPTARSLLQ